MPLLPHPQDALRYGILGVGARQRPDEGDQDRIGLGE